MPVTRRCEKSGALIFDLTPEEALAKETQKRLAQLEKTVAEQAENIEILRKKVTADDSRSKPDCNE